MAMADLFFFSYSELALVKFPQPIYFKTLAYGLLAVNKLGVIARTLKKKLEIVFICSFGCCLYNFPISRARYGK